MLSKWSWIVLNLYIVCVSSATIQEVKAFIQLVELDYEEKCHNTTDVEWSFIISPSNETLSTWEALQHSYAEFKKARRAEILDNPELKIYHSKKLFDPLIQYKYDLIEKPGDALLKEEDLKKLVHFAGVVELQRSTINYVNKPQNYSREDVEYLLSHNGRPDDKKAAWTAWYQQFKSLVTNYSNILPLATEAAKKNDAKNVEEYWEMLSGYPNIYEKIRNDWSNINILHKKILKFISKNLSQKYGIAINDTIPAYLLGSLQGYDWTDLSSDALPFPSLIYDIKKNLWKKIYAGENLYKLASTFGSKLLKDIPVREFWDKSEYKQQCPSRLLNFCENNEMRLSTCSKATVSNFLKAHEDIGKILFNQMSIEDTPVLNTVNRYSGLEESISTLFGIVSASPAWLNFTHLLNATNNDEQRMIVSLMITALNIFPRLAYYYSADMWRINAIRNNITDPADLVSSWWKYRQEYEGVSSSSMDSPTFLDDTYIISNKPYLPKIIGIILAFQLYEYTMDSTEVRYNPIDEKLITNKIIKMMRSSGVHKWQYMLDTFLNIDDISADALVSYFTPLEEYIEENEEEFTYQSGLREDEELEELEKRILQQINNPTTTPSPITTTSVKITIKPLLSKSNASKSNGLKIEESLESKSSVYIREDKPKSPDSSGLDQEPIGVLSDKSSTSDTSDDAQIKPKINTNKAIWAVSAILIAIIAICMIAIFGRRRCRKTPKNRR